MPLLAVHQQFPEETKAEELNADQHEQYCEEQQRTIPDSCAAKYLLHGQPEANETTGRQRYDPRHAQHVHWTLPILREKRHREQVQKPFDQPGQPVL